MLFPMKKKDYKQEIHAVFEQERATITVVDEFDLSKLGFLERFETRLLEKNSRESLQEIKEYVNHRKQRTFVFPLAKKKYFLLRSGKIKELPFVGA